MEASTQSHQLRYYIALSAPPIRTPIEGNEAFMRPEVGFNPSWFHKFCGLNFGKEWHLNPENRLKTYEVMSAEVKKRFPGKNIGGILDGKPIDLLTGVYGASVIPAIFGMELKYYDDKWPAHIGEHLTDEQALKLKAVDWDNNQIFQDILRQMDIIEKLTGSVRGFLNWQGVLNMAFRLRGQQIFMDIMENPELAHHLFDVISTSLIDGINKLYKRQNQSGVNYEFASIGNCVVNMLSPDQYNEFIFPYDSKIRSRFKNFGIHNCAWNVDPYVESYAKIPNLGYIDMGQVSNLKKIKQALPNARRNVLYTSMDMTSKSKTEIRNDMERIAQEIAPCDIGLPDMELDVPDEKINYVFDLCDEFDTKYNK